MAVISEEDWLTKMNLEGGLFEALEVYGLSWIELEDGTDLQRHVCLVQEALDSVRESIEYIENAASEYEV